MIHKQEIDIGATPISLETGKWAQQASGAVVVRQGDLVLLATACASREPREGVDFLPLSVDVAEKFYAVGKLPGGYFKREGRPSSEAILAARLCDRPLRPLFPAGYRNETQIIVTLLSADRVHPHTALGIVGASAALAISDIPFDDPIGACVIGLIDDELLVNPTYEELQRSKLDLTVAGTEDAIMMVEAGAAIVPEATLLEALRLAQEENGKIVRAIRDLQADAGKPKFAVAAPPPEAASVEQAVRDHVGDSISATLLKAKDQQDHKDEVANVLAEAAAALQDHDPGLVKEMLYKMEKEAVRDCILNSAIRPDGRGVDEIRPLNSEVDVLPRAHGSAVFTRGETQILNVVTLASVDDAQRLDGFGLNTERLFIHHYNFPPYSTGEAGRFGFTGRREIGHGALAERALLPVVPDTETFPYTIRTVSEALSSNGSTSMASVCSASLALMDAGVPVLAPVAGIAMGLITNSETGQYEVLTDIQGAEDHSGDMDFKVAGTHQGVTALQMDIKVKGISFEIMEQALEKAHKARITLLEHMNETLSQTRSELSSHAPRMHTMNIPADKIGTLIGPGGSTIRGLTQEYDVSINVEDSGKVIIGATKKESAELVEQIITTLCGNIEIGQRFRGRVVRILPFGAFVELVPGKEGMVHISELSDQRVESVEATVSIDDEVEVIVIKVDEMGRVGLSMRDLDRTIGLDDDEYTSRPRGRNDRPPNRERTRRSDQERPGRHPRDGGGSESRRRFGDRGRSDQERPGRHPRDGGGSESRRRVGDRGRNSRPKPPNW